MAIKVVTDFAKTLLVFLSSSSLFQSPLQYSNFDKASSLASSDFALAAFEPSNPTAECLKHTYIDEAVACFDRFTVDWEVYTQETYDKAQPTPEERSAWLSTITALLDVQGDCHAVKIPDALNSIYTISEIDSYCVLSEVRGNGTQYDKGWGLFVTPATLSAASRNIHLSAPHPAYDLNTPQQAAALFKSTGAKSLLIAGRSRGAFQEPSDCVPSPRKSTYYMTDPAHNKEEPFYDATRSIYNWQMNNGGCPAENCAFIQFHGKGTSTCRNDQIFISAGLGNDVASRTWYLDGVPRPAKRLKTQLQLAFPAWNVSMPSDSKCLLTATKTVVGRFLNGIDDSLVCSTDSNSSLATGMFVHIEQAAISRKNVSYAAWTQALLRTFDSI